EAVQATLGDLRQSGLGLALVARGLLGDLALGLDRLGRDVLALEEGRREGRDVRRDVASDPGTCGVGRDEHADLRGEVLGDLVEVELDSLARDAGDAADDELLAEGRGSLLDDALDGRAARGSREKRLDVLGARGDSS